MTRGWLIAIAACGGPAALPASSTAPAPRSIGATLAFAGESFEYEVRWRGILLGTAQTAIGQPGELDGHRAVIVRTIARSDGLVDALGRASWELETVIDLDTGWFVRDRETVAATFAGKTFEARHEHAWSADRPMHDLHSAIGAMRAWSSPARDRLELDLVLAASRFTTRAWQTGREVVATRGRAVPADRYDGTVSNVDDDRAGGRGRFRAWLSDDTARVPLRVRAPTPLGEVVVELVDYEAPRE